MSNLLRIDSLSVHYGPIQALRGISLHVDQGEVVTIIGANGGAEAHC